ncbi:hypothetical protein Cgig2_005940 [Carnegiea gigantea]|uniref:C3H1-type domain-containing protein n=2 Tax=Magnoliopsida TaxID=3398 RepID=A0A9Q1QJ06_9CARY|nr:hypothetical protein Cgig2_005940 [Carnegiea gigantea]
MDHHRHHHQQRHHNLEFMDSRYFPVRPPPPSHPPLRPFHGGDPNLYQHHHPPLPPLPPPHHHHIPYHHPPPQLPRSPTPQYRPPSQIIHQAPPPPPLPPQHPPASLPYHHHHHHSLQQRVHEVNFVNSPPIHHRERTFDFPPSPRVPPNQGVVYDNNNHYRDDDRLRFYLPEPPPRVSAVASIAPPISSCGFNRPVDFNRISPPFREIQIDEFRHSPNRFGDDLESLRLRSDELEEWRDDRRIMDDLERDRLEDHHFHDQYHPEMLPREFDLNPGRLECVPGPMADELLLEDSRDGIIMDEDIDVRYDVQASSREVSCSPIKFRNRGINRDDGFRQFYEGEMSRGSDSGRYYERGKRQEMQDCSRTPRKNLRKKSAFLRILPLKHSNLRNRHDTTTSPHKGKESLEALGHRLSEERHGSPVELDVSFKSNSLVAKAIMAAPSKSEVDPTENSSSNDLDIRIDGMSPSKNEGNRNCGDNSSVSSKVEKHTKKRVRISPALKRVGLPSNVDVCGSNTELPSNGSSSLNGGSSHSGSPKVEVSDNDNSNPGPGNVSSPSIRKKRKSNRLLSRLSGSPSKTNAKLVNGSSLAHHPSGSSMSDVCIKQRGKESSSSDQVVGSTENETTIDTEKEDINGSPIVVVQAVGRTFSEASFRKRMRKKGILKPTLDSSGALGPSVSETPRKVSRGVDNMQKVLNADEDATKSVNRCTLYSSIEGDSNESQVVVPELVDNDSGKGSSEPFIFIGCNVDNIDIVSEDLQKHDTLDVSNSILSPLTAPVKVQEGGDVSCIGRPCRTKVISSPENGIMEQSGGKEHFDAIDSNKNERENPSFLLKSSKVYMSSDKTTGTFSHVDIAVDYEKSTTICGPKATNDIQEEQCRHEGTVSVSGADREGPSKSFLSVGGDLTLISGEGDPPGPVFNRKRKSQYELQYLNSGISESPYDTAGTKIYLMMNSNLPIEKPGSTVLGLPCCSAGSGVPLRKGVKNSCPESITSTNHSHNSDASEYPPHHSKKIKILPFESVLSDASFSQNCDIPAPSYSVISMAEVPWSSIENSTSPAEEIKLSNTVLLDKNAVDRASDRLRTRHSVPDSSNADLCNGDQCLSVYENAPVAEKWSSCLLCKQEGNVNLVTGGPIDKSIALKSEGRMTTNNQNDGIHCMEIDKIGNSSYGSLGTDVVCEHNIAANDNLPSGSDCLRTDDECTNDRATTDDRTGDSGHGPLFTDIRFRGNIAVNDNGSDCPHLHAEFTHDGATTAFEMGTHSNDGSSDADSLRTHPLHSGTVPALNFSSGGKLGADAEKSGETLVAKSYLPLHSNSLIKKYATNSKPGISAAAAADQSFAHKDVVSAKNVKNSASRVNPVNRQPIRRNVLLRADANFPSSRASSVATPSKALSTYPVKPRTWRRTDNFPVSNMPLKKPCLGTVPPQRPPIGKTIKVQSTSYIRKGNILLRNPTSGAATMGPGVFSAPMNWSKSNDANNITKATGSLEIDSTVVPDRLMTGGQNTHVEMPRTPPLPCSGMVPDHETGQSPPPVGQSEGIHNEAAKSSDTAASSSRNPGTDMDRSLEDPGTLSDGNFPASNSKSIVYIRHKSNQLIAASNPSKPPVHKMDKAPALSSDNGYYKRRKNQLIRASSEGNIQHMLSKIDDISNSQPQKALNLYSGRNSTRRRSNKGKPPKVSLVWKLGDPKSSGKGVNPLRCGKILSHLLPWKRATYWRSVWQSSANFSSNSSLMITRKLLSPKKRAAVYVRSGRGFSLRRSKVISLAGYSLKWSKSMEKRSKKVDEEAARAIAKVDSGERPKTGASGERIFRIGMFRYRMDPSRRTLQRIAVIGTDHDPLIDEASSNSAAPKPEHGAKKTYVPKRLLIGSNEYVRIGNGNKLVRDPKRRTRLLASEKVRWSLHTARMRLAKKRKFCQFFTRFGKCNKGEGKCPYIHDPSKIAVCTKFLNGLCGDPSCKLTHKVDHLMLHDGIRAGLCHIFSSCSWLKSILVIPERMPDCSFFLQGSCSNENCPYRHVNVNPKAPVCENFLRGYCAEGNECRKKHSYICPEFEATGSCPQGSKCKLYHPKKGNGKKRKTSKDQRNSRGRYFGSGLTTTSESEIDMTEKIIAQKNGLEENQGELGDFISLDESDDELRENDDPTAEPMSILPDDQVVNSELDDPAELILPLRILDRRSLFTG